ncbi:MAG: hypothetical protein IJ071_09675 [Ruminococcus sp.]|nr:hypothetical protein [Ruminococcus sp.]
MLFILSVVLFIVFKIPRLFKELTGIAADQEIKGYDFSSSKSHSGALKAGKRRSRMSSIMTDSGDLKETSGIHGAAKETDKLKTAELADKQDKIAEKARYAAESHRSSQEMLPVTDPFKKFAVVREFGFTSSMEIIE